VANNSPDSRVEHTTLRYTCASVLRLFSCGSHITCKRRMSKEDSIEVTGTVVEKFPSGLFSVQLDQDRTVLAHLAGKLRRNRIRVLAGDRVTLEMSPYDLTKGRITYRHK
jgi:translation initiation factor IF-1